MTATPEITPEAVRQRYRAGGSRVKRFGATSGRLPAGGVGACEAVHVGFELRGSGRAGAAGTALTGGLWAPKAMVIAALGTPGAGGAAPWGIP